MRKTGVAIIQTTLAIDLGLVALLFSYYRSVSIMSILIMISLTIATATTLMLLPRLLMRLFRSKGDLGEATA